MPKPAGAQPGRKGAPGAKPAGGASEAMQVLFGENFHAARIKRGLTQMDIEALTGIQQAYVSQIEGGRQNPTLATMTVLAQAVETPVHQLLRPQAARVKRK